MDNQDFHQTCVLKVNLEGCKECAVNLKKNLAEIDGVHEVDVDEEKGLVKVSGKVDPEILMNKIAEKKKKKKTVELLSYEDPNNITPIKHSKRMQKKIDHDFEDHMPRKVYEDFDCSRDSNSRFQPKKPIIHGNHYDLPMVNLQPPKPLWFPPPNPHRFPSPPPYLHYPRHSPPYPHRFPPPPPNPHYPRHYGRPIVPQYYHGGCCPGMGPQSLPPLPPYGYDGVRHVPTHNDITYFFSDENAVGCSVM